MPAYEIEATDVVKVRRVYHIEAANEAEARREAALGEGLVFVDEEPEQAITGRTVERVTEIDDDGEPVEARSAA